MSIKAIFGKRNRVLIAELVRTDFKLRYQGSVLGYVWALLKPLFLFAILYVVFGLVLRFGDVVPNFPVYLLLGIVLWSFFADATRQGKSSIVARGDLIRKIRFPKYVIVVASTISALINLLLNLVAVFVFILISGTEIKPIAIILFPLLILQLYILSLAISFYLAAVNVRYRDVGHIWDIFLQGGFYATPIFYPLPLILERSELVAQLMLLNPVAQIIHDSRYLLITQETITTYAIGMSWLYYAVPFLIVAAISVLAAIFFRKRSDRFAEDI